MNNFIHLHTHSHGSMRDGCQTPKQIAEKAKSLDMKAVALTDHGWCGELLTFKKECEKIGINPILGCETYCAPTSHLLKEKEENHPKTSYHITLLAKNDIGRKNLFTLSSLGWLEGYYYKPRCILSGQEILTAEGIKSIEEIRVGDLVVTHRGRVRPVTKIMKNYYKGQLFGINLNNRYGRTTWMTPEHPVLIYNQQTKQRQWIEAQNIVPGRFNKQEEMSSWSSFACLPKIQTSSTICQIKVSEIIRETGWEQKGTNIFARKNKLERFGKRSELSDTIPLDYNFGFFLGLYIAEGHIDKGSVLFSFHKKEKDLINKCLTFAEILTGKFFKDKGRKDRENYKGRTISINSVPLVCFMKNLCGSTAHNKKLPFFTFEAPVEFQRGLYKGILAGDGAIHPKITIFTQTSQILAWQMRILAATFDNTYSSIKEYDDGDPNHSLQYRCNFSRSETDLKHRNILYDDRYVYRPISEVNKKYYSGLVYNIEVKDDHSYVSDFAMHNCDMQLLEQYKEGLIVLSGCSSAGRASVMILENRIEEAIEYLNWGRNTWGDDFYIEVQNHKLDWQQDLNKVLYSLSKDLSIPTVATQDSHYTNKEDSNLHNHICKLAAGDLQFDSDQSWFKSREEMEEVFPKHKESLDITEDIADKCVCNWDYSKTIWPIYELPNGTTPEQELRRKTKEGFEKLFGRGTKEYIDRIEQELSTIDKMGFSTYFLVVSDFMHWARENDIYTGPGRGSGAGSLVCYCIGITEVDSIKYGLYFERFLNSSRVSPPDLDLDLDPEDRKRVMDYLCQKYGEDKFAQIGTTAQFKPKGSLRDFARVCGYDLSVGEKLASLIPPSIAGRPLSFEEAINAEPKLINNEYQDVVNLARKAEGLKKQAGVHAAGVVISNTDIKTQVPLFRGRNNEVTTQFTMSDIEEIGLIKYDLLGLKNLTVIKNALKLIKETTGDDLDLSSLNDGDKETYNKTFKQGNLDGIFQFETSGGFRELCIQVQPNSIEDLSAVVSLYRPGPIQTGLLQQYIDGRNGKTVEYLTPKLEPILKNTFGALCYQEQVMQICVQLAGYSLLEADNMRRIIGKKKIDQMKAEGEKFISGCIKNKISESIATQIFDWIKGFAEYSFNRCLTGDTLILLKDNKKVSIEEIKGLLSDGDKVFLKSFVDEEIIFDECIGVVDTGEQEVYKIELSNGTYVEATLEHKFLCSDLKMHTVKEILSEDLDLYDTNIISYPIVKRVSGGYNGEEILESENY